MGYVAVKGGQEAIKNAKELIEFFRLRDAENPVTISQITSQFRMGLDKIMGEGSFYAPDYAAIAFKQTEGDVLEAAFILRAYRATLPRNFYSIPVDTEKMSLERRISASFREIPGGQILGPTRDYTIRLIDEKMTSEDQSSRLKFLEDFEARHQLKNGQPVNLSASCKKIVRILREQSLLANGSENEDRTFTDITREAIRFPAPRSVRLQMLARAETGGLMALGYSSMRGHGAVHPTIGELRVGSVAVKVKDRKGRNRYIGKIRVTEAEMISKAVSSRKSNIPYYSVGYGLCFGHNETKAICMGILDRAMREKNQDIPSHNHEFVLYHTEGIESLGFTNHLKLPHYVTFQSDLNNLRQAIHRNNEKLEKAITQHLT